MLLALFAPLCIPRAIFPHAWPVISCTNGLRREGLAADVGTAYPLMQFFHNAQALLISYTYQHRVGEPMPKQLSINQGVLA